HKVNSHLKLVADVYKILPITKLVIEVASFDIQKIKNPNISGAEYQQGEKLDAWNVREYVLWRDGHTCQHCKGKSKDKILQTHHLESRKVGGDAPSNLVTLCKTCHDAYHAGKLQL
ncbi:RRXRR domain-containing protein, partial [Dysgonomonas sp. 25]|uniref:RRXRR domain-containing protein n=1 Tax=Dysgonomonas sp. 25 TaxID=2302933 RepID=UPI00162556D9